MAMNDMATTPRPPTVPLQDEKSLPPPPLEEILWERRQRLDESKATSRNEDIESSSRSTFNSARASPVTPPHSYHQPQAWPSSPPLPSPYASSCNGFRSASSAKSSPLLASSHQMLHHSPNACKAEATQEGFKLSPDLGDSTISARRRMDSKASSTSSKSVDSLSRSFTKQSLKSTNSPPFTRRETMSSFGHTGSSDRSSNASASARGSYWSNSHMSRNTSWGTQASTPLTTASNSRDWNHSEAPVDEIEKQSQEDVGLGITSDVGAPTRAGVRRSRMAITAASMPDSILSRTNSNEATAGVTSNSDASNQEADRWAHHRAPSWTRKVGVMAMAPLPATSRASVSAAESSPVASAAVISRRPSINRMVSEPSMTENVGSNATIAASVGAPLLPPQAIPPRVNSRMRTRSEVSGSHRRHASVASSASSVTGSVSSSSVKEQHSMGALGSVSPRDSSLRRPSRRRAPSAASSTNVSASTSLRSSVSLKALTNGASGPLQKLGGRRESIKDLSSNLEEVLSSRTNSPAFDNLHHRFWTGRSRSSSTVSNSRMSFDIKTLGLDFPHAATTPTESAFEIGNAVRLVEEGEGVVIEAKGRPLEAFAHEIGPETTHLLLGGCCSDDLGSFLAGAIATAKDSLLVLDVSFTNLRTLPSALTACYHIEELNISGLRLGEAGLPHWLGSLSNLRVLFADQLGINQLPLCISQMSELSTLSIRRNQLLHLPSWMCLLSKLERLYLEGNPFFGLWNEVLSSIFPKQVPVIQMRGEPPSTSTSAAASPTSTAPSSIHETAERPPSTPSESPKSRRPTLNRMKSDNEVSKKLFPMSPAVTRNGSDQWSASSSQFDVSSSGSLASANGPTHQKDTLDREATVRGRLPESDSKWSFLRKKVTRKASQPGNLNTSAGFALSRAAAPSDVEAIATVKDSGSEGGSADHKSLPKIQTGATLRARKGLPIMGSALPRHEGADLKQGRDKLMAAFVPKAASRGAEVPPTSQGQSNTLHIAVPEHKRRSYLIVDQTSSGVDMSSEPSPSASACPSSASSLQWKEDPLDWKSRIHALMCHLRDLDDLAPGAIARRNAFGNSEAASEIGSTVGIHQSGPYPDPVSTNSENSPIRRRPSGMALSSVPIAAATEVRDDSRRRHRIIAEIISSEESYIRGLQELCDIYVGPSRLSDDKSTQPILPSQEHRAIFGNVEGLLQFHADAFLPSLKACTAGLLTSGPGDDDGDDDCQRTAQVAEAVGSVFVKHSGWFRMYSAYINGCDEAQALIALYMSTTSNSATAVLRSAAATATSGSSNIDLVSGKELASMTPGQKKRFKTFMKRSREHPRHSQLSIESYLLLPVQRIPRYELLLRDLARSTDPSRLEDPKALTCALGQISSIAASVNESKRQSEQDRKLLAWQSRLRTQWQTPLVLPHRRLIRDGQLQLRRIVSRVRAYPSAATPSTALTMMDKDEAACDGAFSSGQDLHLECLERRIVSINVTLLLCNDVGVLVEETQRDSPNAPVNFFSFLRLRPAASGSARCQLLGQTYLRIVDTQRIYHFSAPSHTEAVAWCESINAVAEAQ